MATVHPTAILGQNVQLDESVVIGPYCVLGNDISIGADTILYSNVMVADHVTIGQGNHLYPTCAIGCCPQVLGMTAATSLGRVIIGDRNMIRENVTIHPSKSEGGATRIGSDVLLMVGTHVGHDCIVGDKVVLSNYVQIAGHVEIGTGAWFAGMSGSHQFVTVGRWSFITGLAGITRDVPPFLIISGHYPAKIRGVNKRGLLRAGLNPKQQEDIYAAYKQLYRRGSSLLANARALAEQNGIDENVRDLVESIFKSHQHRFGRYRESLRTH
jgi:UDP-N-acetylglucosamine acyltransferase